MKKHPLCISKDLLLCARTVLSSSFLADFSFFYTPLHLIYRWFWWHYAHMTSSWFSANFSSEWIILNRFVTYSVTYGVLPSVQRWIQVESLCLFVILICFGFLINSNRSSGFFGSLSKLLVFPNSFYSLSTSFYFSFLPISHLTELI